MSGPVRTPARRAIAITLSAETARIPANVLCSHRLLHNAFCVGLSERHGHAARIGADSGPTHADEPLEQVTARADWPANH